MGFTAVVTGIGPQEANVRTHAVQSHQRLADPEIINVPFKINAEVVITQRFLGWARLQSSQINTSNYNQNTERSLKLISMLEKMALMFSMEEKFWLVGERNVIIINSFRQVTFCFHTYL